MTYSMGINRQRLFVAVLSLLAWAALIALRQYLSAILAACLCLDLLIGLATVILLYAPVRDRELLLWHRLNVNRWRHWITRWRDPRQPLEMHRTARIARQSLLWHLLFTVLFGSLTLQALWNSELWFRSLSALLIFPSIAYLAASIVQRQKIAILTMRGERPG